MLSALYIYILYIILYILLIYILKKRNNIIYSLNMLITTPLLDDKSYKMVC